MTQSIERIERYDSVKRCRVVEYKPVQDSPASLIKEKSQQSIHGIDGISLSQKAIHK